MSKRRIDFPQKWTSKMKLFTIGDSVSQGFMSLAAARTDNAYSTLIARQIGLKLNTDDYRFA
ncbi:MAG TPA: hypothetical protein VGD05_06310, partial [Pyrinomonadaceae bacterium]